MIFKSKNTKETQKLAADLARKIVKSKPQRHARVFALEGELGAGKTTFVQGFAKALKIKQGITSPTFVLLKKYALVKSKTYNLKPKTYLYHVDAFRLRDWRDLTPLGIKEIFADPANIVLIEWAERVKPLLPKKRIWIHIDHLDKNSRRIKITWPKN
jgi:tRNA threonylcarbamoyladenosine biosynthesis protein TsaE